MISTPVLNLNPRITRDPLEPPSFDARKTVTSDPEEPGPIDYPWEPFITTDPLETNWGFGRRENQFNQSIGRAVEARWEHADHPLPPRLFKALVAAESGFDPRARSGAGAVGLVQLMPGTAKAFGLKLSPRDERLSPDKSLPVGVAVLSEKFGYIYNPPTNREWGEKVAKYFERFGKPSEEQMQTLALAGYNGGASTVVRAMAQAYDDGLDPRDWSNLVGDRANPSSTPLYKAIEETFGAGRAAAKYREMSNYPDRVTGFFETAAQPLAGTRIMLDPGHGGKFAGAIGPTGVNEKDVTLGVSLKLRDKLQALGAEVRMTRTTDATVAPGNPSQTEDLRARVALANRWPAELFISVHCNSAENAAAHGTEVWVSKDASRQSQALAREVHRDMVDQLGLEGRGVKRANFHVIKNTSMPGILVETAFVSNPIEERLLGDDAFQQRIADSIASGVVKYEQAQAIERGEDPLDQGLPEDGYLVA